MGFEEALADKRIVEKHTIASKGSGSIATIACSIAITSRASGSQCTTELHDSCHGDPKQLLALTQQSKKRAGGGGGREGALLPKASLGTGTTNALWHGRLPGKSRDKKPSNSPRTRKDGRPIVVGVREKRFGG